MFDIGGPELLVIAIIAIIVIGPRELPGAIRTITLWIRKARGLAAEFRSGLDEMVRDTELDEVKRDIESAIDPYEVENSIKGDLENAIDPDGDMKQAFDPADDWYGPDEELDDIADVQSPSIMDDDPDAERVAAQAEDPETASPEPEPPAESADDDAAAQPSGVRATS